MWSPIRGTSSALVRPDRWPYTTDKDHDDEDEDGGHGDDEDDEDDGGGDDDDDDDDGGNTDKFPKLRFFFRKAKKRLKPTRYCGR